MDETMIRDVETPVVDRDERPQSQPGELSRRMVRAKEFYRRGIYEREKYERQWYMNMSFYLGFQWVRWNTSMRQLQMSLDPAHRKRVTVNKVLGLVEREVSRIVRTKPKYVAVPADVTEEAKDDARVSEDILEHLNRILGIEEINTQLAKTMCIFGTGFKSIFWDKYGGDVIDDGEGGEIPIGEVGVEVLSPFNVVVEPGCLYHDDLERVAIVKSRSLGWIRKHFPEWGYLVQAEQDTATSSLERQMQNLLNNLTTSVSGTTGISGDKGYGYANVVEYRELPTDECPYGRVIIFAGDILLAEGDLPLRVMRRRRQLGILKYDFLTVLGRYWGRSYIEDLIPIQVEYNKSLSQMVEHRNLFKGKWLKPMGMKMNPRKPNTESGEIIEYEARPGLNPPVMVSPPPLPSYYERLLERAVRDMQDISSQHEISKAGNPPGVTAGVALQTLAEMDTTQYSSVHLRFGLREEAAGMLMLEVVNEKYNEPRMLVLSSGNELRVRMFSKERDLPTKVIVQRESSLPDLKSARIGLVLQLADKGLIDKGDRHKIFELLEFGTLAEEIDKQTADERRAKLENSRIETNLPLRVERFDDHRIHLQVHMDYQKSVKYERLSLEQRAKIDTHVAVHGGAAAGVLVQRDGRWVEKQQPPSSMPLGAAGGVGLHGQGGTNAV